MTLMGWWRPATKRWPAGRSEAEHPPLAGLVEHEAAAGHIDAGDTPARWQQGWQPRSGADAAAANANGTALIPHLHKGLSLAGATDHAGEAQITGWCGSGLSAWLEQGREGIHASGG